MWWLTAGFSIFCVVGIIYMIRYYRLANSIKHMALQIKEVEQNPEDNRILLLSHFQKDMEVLCEIMNNYILTNQKMRISYNNREKKLRRQIESISHDLRTPLTAMLGYLSFIDEKQLDKESREALEVVERKGRSLQSLICNFYDLSRLEMEDYQLSMEKINLTRFLTETILSSYQELEQSGLEVLMETGEEPVFLMADTNGLERIFYNMIQNVIRYGETYFKVSVEKTEEKVFAVFENDTYTLTQKDIPHIFERFYVKDKSRTKQGTGLGLTISKLLAEAMGGQAEAKLAESKLSIVFSWDRMKG